MTALTATAAPAHAECPAHGFLSTLLSSAIRAIGSDADAHAAERVDVAPGSTWCLLSLMGGKVAGAVIAAALHKGKILSVSLLMIASVGGALLRHECASVKLHQQQGTGIVSPSLVP